MSKCFLFIFCCFVSPVLAAGLDADFTEKLICVGRVEPVDGEVEVSSRMAGTLAAVLVKEGDWVTNGTILAEVDAPREKAALDLALARLNRVKAGNGKEEIAAAAASRDALIAGSVFADSDYRRAMNLSQQHVVSEDELEKKRQEADVLHKQVTSAEKQLEALKRGPLPEDVALADAEVESARADYDQRLVRAGADGYVLELHRHGGDYVTLNFPTPILRMANTRKTRARIEINEQDVYRVKTGMAAEFTTFDTSQRGGQLTVKEILPSFAPRRLFDPDSTARMDTRTIQVLCDLAASVQIYAGQRVTATFKIKN